MIIEDPTNSTAEHKKEEIFHRIIPSSEGINIENLEKSSLALE